MGPVSTMCERSPVLVVDDVEVQHLTKWGKQQVGELIRHREAAELPSVWVSSEPMEKWDGPVVSRLMSGQVVVLSGPDRRRVRNGNSRF